MHHTKEHQVVILEAVFLNEQCTCTYLTAQWAPEIIMASNSTKEM